MFCVSVKPWLHSGISTWVPSSWTLRKIEVSRQSGTLVKEQGSHDFNNRLRGTKSLSKRPRHIGTERAQTHLLFYSILHLASWRHVMLTG